MQLGRTPLHVACYWGNTRAIEELIKKKARVDIKDEVRAKGLVVSTEITETLGKEGRLGLKLRRMVSGR